MAPQDGDQLASDRPDGVEGGARLLEDEADPTAAQAAQLPLGERADAAPLEEDLACDPPARIGHQVEEREARDGLSRARLADERDDLAPRHIERHPVDDTRAAEGDGERPDGEERRVARDVGEGRCSSKPR